MQGTLERALVVVDKREMQLQRRAAQAFERSVSLVSRVGAYEIARCICLAESETRTT